MALLRLLLVTAALSCSESPPCAPLAPPDAACGRTFDVSFDSTAQTGCVFVNGSGTPDTCASLCGGTATCDQVTFSDVECTTTCN